MSERIQYPRLYKIILLGDGGVGKTSIMLRFVSKINIQNMKVQSTIGTDFKSARIEVDGEIMKLSIWTPSGDQHFRAPLMKALYRNVDAVVFVYDVTKKETFDHIERWFNACAENDIDLSSIPCALFANKCDLPLEEITVGKECGEEFARKCKMMFCYSSTYLDSEQENVNHLFFELGRMLKYSRRQLIADPDIISLTQEPPKKKSFIEYLKCPFKFWPFNR